MRPPFVARDGTDRQSGVPLGKTAGDAAVDGGFSEIEGLSDAAAEETVQQAVFEAGEQGRGKAAGSKEGMGACFP